MPTDQFGLFGLFAPAPSAPPPRPRPTPPDPPGPLPGGHAVDRWFTATQRTAHDVAACSRCSAILYRPTGSTDLAAIRIYNPATKELDHLQGDACRGRNRFGSAPLNPSAIS